jgi:ABC-2 type transport system ATP-binding protein
MYPSDNHGGYIPASDELLLFKERETEEKGGFSMSPTLENRYAIEVQNLVKRYPKATANAVDDVSFTVKRGEIFGLLGPNGAGKTTVIGMLTTRVIASSGVARIMGIDVARDPIGAKQSFSVVPQRTNLDLSLNARDILTFHASYHGAPAAARKALADKLLEEFGLADRSKDLVKQYSGGMAQRVMIARALMHTPQVLFLDEPTNNLDPQARLFLWERIRSLQERGVTVLLTTHDMEEASQLCDRIAIVDHGRILVCDTPTQLEKIIPGGTSLELQISTPKQVPERVLVAKGAAEAPTDIPVLVQLQEKLGSLPGVTKIEEVHASKKSEEQADLAVLRLYGEDVLTIISQVGHVIAEWNCDLRDLHLVRPSLENVFIYLTGRKLRS